MHWSGFTWSVCLLIFIASLPKVKLKLKTQPQFQKCGTPWKIYIETVKMLEPKATKGWKNHQYWQEVEEHFAINWLGIKRRS